VREIPSDPMKEHARFMQAFCEDLLARDYHAPRAKAVVEITRQTKGGRVAQKAPASNSK